MDSNALAEGTRRSAVLDTDKISYACRACKDWGMDDATNPCRLCKPTKWLAWRIEADPAIVLVTSDGHRARPVQPPQFESIPDDATVCSAAVVVWFEDGPNPIARRTVSLCHLTPADAAGGAA